MSFAERMDAFVVNLRLDLGNCLVNFLPPYRFWGLKRVLMKFAGIKMGKNCQFVGGGAMQFFSPSVIMGDNCYIGADNKFYLERYPYKKDVFVKLGDNVDIGPNVWFMSGSHEYGRPYKRAWTDIQRTITVEDGVWIGMGSKLILGVTVGKGAVIATGAVVNKNVPPNTLVAGVPARVIKVLNEDWEDAVSNMGDAPVKTMKIPDNVVFAKKSAQGMTADEKRDYIRKLNEDAENYFASLEGQTR